ncbi:hypothetical protein BGZ73_004533 [Actinomortierella ambigua]|nr:hypothetical protein BGZ73_004533 [Actinomortierella ambigua]
MTPLIKSAYSLRLVAFILAAAVLAGCVWMQLIYRGHRTVIARGKYYGEFALAGLSVLGYPLSLLFRRLGRVRSQILSVVFILFGGAFGLAWMFLTFGVLVLRERQVMAADYPQSTDRDLIKDWELYASPVNRTILQCPDEPNSSLGPALALTLCKIDGAVAAVGALCGVVVLIETMLSSLSEQTTNRKYEQSRQSNEEPEVELTIQGARS